MDLRRLLAAPQVRAMVNEGSLLATLFDPASAPTHLRLPDCMLVEHEGIAFPSYPYEWAPVMLHAAAELMLRLAWEVQESGFVLNNASAYNVLFRGPNPVFVDMLSFRPWDARDASWPVSAQFLRMFLLPLMVYANVGLDPRSLLLANRDGIDVKDVQKLIPVWGSGGEKHRENIEPPSILERLERQLDAVKSALDSRVPEQNGNGYPPEQARMKRLFASECFRAIVPGRVLDLRCGTGELSVMAAAAGGSVVALDSDTAAVDRLWRHASAENLDILPLSIDIAHPTPATGWKNAEFPSFLSRAQAMEFDCVLLPALGPAIEERRALPEMISLAANLTTDAAIVEYGVEAEGLSQNRQQHNNCTPEQFENICLHHFHIERMLRLPGSSRVLYLLRRRH
jgi:hypothetical protein